MVLFDDVFVPWERVFMSGTKKGEWEFGGRLALLFALNHRNSYCGCKPAMVDIIVGASALAAEYNGVGKSKHIEMKLAEMLSVAELTYAAGTASSVLERYSRAGLARQIRFMPMSADGTRVRTYTARIRDWLK